MNASSPAYVLACVFDNALGLREPNAMYNSVLQSVNVVVGEGNAGAVGLRWRGAQGTGVEDVRIEFEGRGPSDGLAGLVGAAGSGGAHHGVTVVGGRYGLDLRQGQPSATVSRATLVNQSCAAVLYEGYEALTAVGVAVSGLRGCVAVRAGFPLALPPAGDACALPPMDNGGQQMPLGTVAGAVALIDARVAWADGANTCAERAVVRTNRSLYLRNLYARGAHTIARFDASAVAAPAAAGGGWSAVHELAHGENPDPQTAGDGKGGKVTFQTLATAYVGGRRSPPGATALANMSAAAAAPTAAALLDPHGWGAPELFPSFEGNATLNVLRPPPASGLRAAAADGFTDDAPALQAALTFAAAKASGYSTVFLPRGVYALGATVRVPPGVALVGVARHLTRLVPTDNFSAAGARAGEPAFVVEVEGGGGAAAPTTLSHIGITVWNSLANVSALRWAADAGIVRQFHAQRSSRCGSLADAGCATSVPIDAPLQLVVGSKALKWFTFYLEDCCRNHTVEPIDVGPAAYRYWDSFLAGPQRDGYRHLVVRGAGSAAPGSISFYHLNCEHGTGAAICEFDGVDGVDVHGFKTEGNTVALQLGGRSRRVRLAGSGGIGCVEGAGRATFDLGDAYEVTFANLVDQQCDAAPNVTVAPDEFGELACVPTHSHTLRHDGFLTPPLEHPVLYKSE